MGGPGSGRWPKGFKVRQSEPSVYELIVSAYQQAQAEEKRTGMYVPMQCPVCQGAISYRGIKKHLKIEHGWRYRDKPFPQPNKESQ